ncbi:hypothetical protein BU23DRAFT_588261 [Bimuria novae-zelandiae CBS 107.79]|uniref:Fungal-type protein kinase domain-containing protein n=1 Tax=Bimuria novae-zelandiae CBS 107.79 TaxID=1447943 RepID=A0A6A5VHA3_9PLEO|nr:hypothetical protein BU23DRAFT_588261 [Bimuria novae-zelandiae CBS 107.79]
MEAVQATIQFAPSFTQPALNTLFPRVCLALHFTAVRIVISIDYLERSLRSRAMADGSRSKIIKANPIGKGLDTFRDSFEFQCRGLAITGADALYHISGDRLRNSLLDLILALLSLPASRSLPSEGSNINLFGDLSVLNTAVNSGNFDIERILPLLRAILNNEPDEVIWDKVYAAVAASTAFTVAKPTTPPLSAPSLASFQQTPWLHNTGSFANSTEHRKYVDGVLKEELGQLYVGVPGFFDAYFGSVPGLESVAQAVFDKCKEGDNPLYRDESGWQGWPKGAKERDVLSWFAPLTGQLLDFAAVNQPASKLRRRPLAQPHQPVQGSTADRKLDVGFVDDPSAGVDSKCRWSQILIPGELKSNPLADKASKAWLDLGRYAREVFAAQDSRRFVLGFTLCGSLMRLWEFDRLGGIASEQFDINKDGLQFVSAVLGFLWLNEEQLGFDPTIITAGDKRYIEIQRDNHTERLVIDSVVKRVPCVTGRATTCWRAHREGDDSRTSLVIKDSWQFPEREEEGELLREATDKDVVNVARYYHHETVCVGGQDDDIRRNVRRGLDITKATNYRPERPESSMPPPSKAGRHASRIGRSSSVAGRKRSSSCTGAPLPPTKRTCSSSPTKGGRATANRVHRRIIVCDYGKAIYKASSQTSLLAALEGCIEGYESLHTRAGMLQCDISPNNLMVNEEDDNPSWRAFLIDLDLAIKEQRENSSGARGKTGTRAFMAIGVLLDDEKHSFMHDLESFFWVLFWICIHHDGPRRERVVKRFDKWNYVDTEELAEIKKGIVGDERDFLKTVEGTFTPHYQPLIPYVNRLRREVFPDGRRWRDPNPKLYLSMKEILRAAQDDLRELAR